MNQFSRRGRKCAAVGARLQFRCRVLSEDQGPPKWIIDGHNLYDLMTPSFFGQNVHLYYLVVGAHSIPVMIDDIPPDPSSDYTSLPRVMPAPEDFVKDEIKLAVRGYI